jgi:hypothetical protein
MAQNYFCYSSALDTDALNIWKAQHGYQEFRLEGGDIVVLNGYKLVFDFLSNFWGGRVAGLEKTGNPADQVHGVLFSVDPKWWSALEHKEGVRTGVSIPISVSISKAGDPIQATAFTTHPERRTESGPLSQNFLQTLLKAYKHWKFPEASLQKLQKLSK